MSIAGRIDHLFIWMRAHAFFYRFSWFTRFLLFAGFLPTGLVKLMGRRFTSIGLDSPIGAFFEAMYQTGLFWRFIGLTQVMAAILLVIPMTTHLGAAIFFPIMLNIFVITVALQFTGTPIVTGLMLLAVSYLVFWDYHRFRGVLFGEAVDLYPRMREHQLDSWERVGFGMFAGSLLLVFLGTRTLFPIAYMPVFVGIGFLGGLLALVRFLTHTRKQTKGTGPAG